MEKCQYGNCQKDGSIIGFVLAKDDTNPNKHKQVNVLACREHSKKSSFFKLGVVSE